MEIFLEMHNEEHLTLYPSHNDCLHSITIYTHTSCLWYSKHMVMVDKIGPSRLTELCGRQHVYIDKDANTCLRKINHIMFKNMEAEAHWIWNINYLWKSTIKCLIRGTL